MAVGLECVSARPSMPAMPHEHSGASLGKLKICDLEILVSFGIRDFEESEIPRILKFLAVPVLCRDNVMQARKRGARRAAVCLEHVSARPNRPAMPHDRSGASL